MESCSFTRTSQQSLGSDFSSGQCLPSRPILCFDNPRAGKATPMLSPHKLRRISPSYPSWRWWKSMLKFLYKRKKERKSSKCLNFQDIVASPNHCFSHLRHWHTARVARSLHVEEAVLIFYVCYQQTAGKIVQLGWVLTVPVAFWSRPCCVRDLGRAQALIYVSRTWGTATEIIYNGLLERRISGFFLEFASRWLWASTSGANKQALEGKSRQWSNFRC